MTMTNLPAAIAGTPMPAPSDARLRLSETRLLSGVSAPTLDSLLNAMAWRSFIAGETVFEHLSSGDEVFFIVEGAFALTMTTAFGRSVAIRTLRTGDHFGEIAALIATPRSVAVIAQSAGVLAACPGGAFRDAMTADGAFASEVAAEFARTVVGLTDRLFEAAALEVRFRLYAELVRLAQAGEQTEDGVRIANAPTHEAIAASIGTRREPVTRELNYLAAEGVVTQIKRDLVIKDVTRLKDLVRGRMGPTLSQHLDWRV